MIFHQGSGKVSLLPSADVYTLLRLMVAGPITNDTPKNSGKRPKQANPPAKPTKKENATLKQRIEILDWHHANGSIQTKTAAHFHTIYHNLQIKQPLISLWVKNEARWRAEYEGSRVSASLTKRVYQTQHPEVTEMLELWVSKAMSDKLL